MAQQESAGRWHTLTEDVISGMAEWRVQHPTGDATGDRTGGG
jgi:hypothetical protein